MKQTSIMIGSLNHSNITATSKGVVLLLILVATYICGLSRSDSRKDQFISVENLAT